MRRFFSLLVVLLLSIGSDVAAQTVITPGGDAPASAGTDQPASGWTGVTWTAITFSAGDYTAGGTMTWTVEAADQSSNRYALVGDIIHWVGAIGGSDLGGVANNELRWALPDGFQVASTAAGTLLVTNNSVENSGRWIAAAGTEYLSVFQQLPGTPWTLGVANTGVAFAIMFQIEPVP